MIDISHHFGPAGNHLLEWTKPHVFYIDLSLHGQLGRVEFAEITQRSNLGIDTEGVAVELPGETNRYRPNQLNIIERHIQLRQDQRLAFRIRPDQFPSRQANRFGVERRQ